MLDTPLVMGLSIRGLLAALVGFFLVRYVYWQLTVGASRRRMIAEHGCKPPAQHIHKGILGKLVGWDVLKENTKAIADGRFAENSRLRRYATHNTIQMRVFRLNTILTIEPENLKTVLSTKFSDYGHSVVRTRSLIPVFGNGIFASDGKTWEHSRAMIRPSFNKGQIADLSMYEEHFHHMLALIPKNGSTVDLQELFFRFTIDSATHYLFGTSVNSLKPDQAHMDSERFAEAFTYVCAEIVKDFQTIRLTKDKKRQADTKFIHDFVDQIVADALAKCDDLEKNTIKTDQGYVFLYELIKVTKDPVVLRNETLNLLLAGRDTTASLLSHTFYVLARRPDIWQKLQAEVDELHGQFPDYEQLKQMKYLKYLLNESLRLYPVVPGNSRMTVKDTILPLGGGPDQKSPVFVPKGSIVAYNVWSLHRRKDLWGEDALEFKPERWQTVRPSWEYLPFNGGPRICIGQNFALTEASFVMVRLLQNFRKIEPRDTAPWRELQTLTIAVRGGVKVGLYA